MENELPRTISVPEAGRRYFDLGKNASYEAVRRGEIPVIRICHRLRVPVIALERMLEQAGLAEVTTRAPDIPTERIKVGKRPEAAA